MCARQDAAMEKEQVEVRERERYPRKPRFMQKQNFPSHPYTGIRRDLLIFVI